MSYAPLETDDGGDEDDTKCFRNKRLLLSILASRYQIMDLRENGKKHIVNRPDYCRESNTTMVSIWRPPNATLGLQLPNRARLMPDG